MVLVGIDTQVHQRHHYRHFCILSPVDNSLLTRTRAIVVVLNILVPNLVVFVLVSCIYHLKNIEDLICIEVNQLLSDRHRLPYLVLGVVLVHSCGVVHSCGCGGVLMGLVLVLR